MHHGVHRQRHAGGPNPFSELHFMLEPALVTADAVRGFRIRSLHRQLHVIQPARNQIGIAFLGQATAK